MTICPPRHIPAAVKMTSKGGVIVARIMGELHLWFVSKELGLPENRKLYSEAVIEAAGKLAVGLVVRK